VGQTEKLIVKILSTSLDTKPTHIRAFLSKTNYSEYNPSTTAKNFISSSICFKDEEGKIEFPYETTPNTNCYFVFSVFTEPLKAGETYYIYIHAYDEGTTNTTNPQNHTFGFLDGANTSERLNITLHYVNYTRCSAPSFIISTDQVSKNGQIKISWSGAASGIQNPITKYRVCYNIGRKPLSDSYY
jgi:hypothetical protein